MKKLILNLFGWLAGQVAGRYQVKIVAITGSVGKTTTKEAIWLVLKQAHSAQRSMYNTNTGWGVAASVISPGFEPIFTSSGKARITLWQMVLLKLKGLWRLVYKQKYPDVLVLEMAADGPGDIGWFNKWFDYDVAVVTTIGDAHLEFYKDRGELVKEKLSIIHKLKSNGLAILNGECEDCKEAQISNTQRKYSFGLGSSNDYWAEKSGDDFVLHGLNSELQVKLPEGRQFIPAALVAFAVGEEFGLTKEQITLGLAELQPIVGRFQITRGQKWTVIDDSYNANTESMKIALLSLRDIAQGRKVAILGGMREMGSVTESGHEQVGQWAARQVDLLIGMGKEGEMIAQSALVAGMKQENVVKILWDENNPNVDSAISQILPILEEGDTVLVKASRALHLDKLVARLMTQFKN